VKKKIIIIFIILLAAAISTTASAAEFNQKLFEELADVVNEVPEIDIPEYEVFELDNGMKFYLASDSSLPIIEMRGYIEAGISLESRENSGISSLMVELMNTGSKNYKESELSRFKELNALSFAITSDLDYFSFSADALISEDEELLNLSAEILKNAKFDRSYFERIVNENKQYYRQQFVRDSSLRNMYFFKNIYGAHPYGYNYDYQLRLDFLDKVKPEDVEKFYENSIVPKKTVIAVNGDFEIEAMKKKLAEKFSDWQVDTSNTKASYVYADPKNHSRTILINKEDATQAKIRMGYNFYSYKYPKRTAFVMGNMIFGSGGFNSRLMENLRTEKGFVYAVNSNTEFNKYGGSYYIDLSVAPEKTAQSIEAVYSEMRSIKSGEKAFKEAELFENINLYNALFPKTYKEQINVLDRIVYERELRGNSEEYINRFIKQYNGLTAQEVQKIYAEELYPQIMTIVIVGPQEKIETVLKENNIEFEVK